VSRTQLSKHAVLAAAPRNDTLWKAEAATAQRQSPDVIILDLMMPTMDGFTALAALSKEERTAHIPVLVLSTLDTEDVQQRCYELGAKRYIRKPFDADVLIGTLEELSEQRQASP
jgi:CheY-like chemotaxis protein